MLLTPQSTRPTLSLSVEARTFTPTFIRSHFDTYMPTCRPSRGFYTRPSKAATLEDLSILRSRVKPLLPAPLLLPEHYAAHFSAMTELEAAVRLFDVPSYDLKGVKLLVKRSEVQEATRRLIPVFSCVLNVPGVVEGRPFLEPGFSTARLRRSGGAYAPLRRCINDTSQQYMLATMMVRTPYSQSLKNELYQRLSSLKMLLETKGEIPSEVEIVARVVAVNAAQGQVTLELPPRWCAVECMMCGTPTGKAMPICGHTTFCKACQNGNFYSVCPFCGIKMTRAKAKTPPARDPLYDDTNAIVYEESVWAPYLWDETDSNNSSSGETISLASSLWDVRFEEAVPTAFVVREALRAAATNKMREALEPRLFPSALHAAGGGGIARDRILCIAAAQATIAGLGGWEIKAAVATTSPVRSLEKALEIIDDDDDDIDDDDVDLLLGSGIVDVAVAGIAERKNDSEHLHWQTTLLKQTKAIEMLESSTLVSPSPSVLSSALLLNLTFADTLLTIQQQAAVRNIVLGAHGRVPYLLVGPAGCGKTRVLCEAMFHLLARGSTVLLVAPTDAAADVALNGLCASGSVHEPLLTAMGFIPAGSGGGIGDGGGFGVAVSPKKSLLLRLCSPARRVDAILNVGLMKYCLLQRGSFIKPSPRILLSSRLVVVTTNALSLLSIGLDTTTTSGSSGSGVDSFSHLIVDEAAQALEPETLAALCAAGPTARVVLVGDPRQLGADVRSVHARSKGFSISLMERLLAGRPSGMTLDSNESIVTSTVRPYDVLVRDALDIIRERQVYLRSQPLQVYTPPPTPPHQSSPLADEDDWSAEAYAEAAALRAAHLVRAHEAAPSALLAAAAAAVGRKLESFTTDVDGSAPSGSPLAHLFSTTLTTIFRSPFALLALPSRLFYADTPLLSAVDAVAGTAAVFCSLSATLGANSQARASWPMLALGVRGNDVRDGIMGDMLNVGNADEALAVTFLVKRLLIDSGNIPSGSLPRDTNDELLLWFPEGTVATDESASAAPPRAPLLMSDIGVIAPFRAGVQAIREALRAVDLYGISVGLPRDFQGQEKTVIIIATSLSQNVGPAAFARRGALNTFPPHVPLGAASVPPAGLFFDPRSLNVALTRARARLYVVGDPHLWLKEPSWAVILQECAGRGSYVGWKGCALPAGVKSEKPKEGVLGIA
jgi:hypothetical protein